MEGKVKRGMTAVTKSASKNRPRASQLRDEVRFENLPRPDHSEI